MTPSPLDNTARMCVHTMTTRPLGLAQCVDALARADIPAVTVWRQHLPDGDARAARRIVTDAGLRVTSLCRGGFFPAVDPARRRDAIDDNRRAVDEAADLGAPLIVLVCGADPAQPLDESRKQIADGIRAVLPHARDAGVRLAIEPLHPMYADTRSAINTLAQANDMVEAIADDALGVTVDVYHLWWDPDLRAQVARAGRSIFSFHVCDWRSPTRDLLNDRGLMGEGCIDIPAIRGWVEDAGFGGDVEVEIFSDRYWAMDQVEFVGLAKRAWLEHV